MKKVMHLRVWHVLALVLLAGMSASPPIVGAQGPTPSLLGRDCATVQLFAPQSDTLPLQWAPFHPVLQVEALKAVPTGDFLGMIDATAARLQATLGLGADTKTVATVQREIARIRALMVDFYAATDTVVYQRRRDTLRNLGPAVFRTNASMDGREYTFFRGSLQPVPITTDTPVATRRSVCYHAAVMGWILDRFSLSAREAAVGFLEAKRALWSRYVQDGHSQFPWELALNNRLAARAAAASLVPSRWQIVAAHPLVSITVPASRLRELERHESVLLEVAGLLRYRADYRSYRGVSAAVTVTEGLGLGAGPFVYLSPALKAGYVWSLRRGEANAQPGGSLVMGVDLYRRLANTQETLEQQLKRLKQRLGES
jgi:hypothetical protein